MKLLRTPEGQFDGLPDYPWSLRYVEVDAGNGSGDRLRVHYVDEGVAANALFPTGDFDLREAFKTGVDFSQQVPEFAGGAIVQNATATEPPPDVVAAYDAPFPDESPSTWVATATKPSRCPSP